MTESPWPRRFDTASQALTGVAVATLLLPTTLIHIALFLVVLLGGLGGNFRAKFQRISANSVALGALGLFVLFGFGVIYTSADFAAGLDVLGKYHKLLYIPIIIAVLREDRWRYRAYLVLLVTILVNMALSYGILAGLLPPGPSGQEYTLFKGRIAWPYFMAFATFLMAHHFVLEPRRRWFWGLLIVMALYNLLYMNSGRTGQIIILFLLMLFSFQQGRWRGLLLGAVAGILLTVLAITTSPLIQQRLTQEAIGLQKENATESSTGLRVDFYKNTLKLIAEHPVWGTGTGSFAPRYLTLAQNIKTAATDNPHNEYLMITTQLGLIGLAAFLLMGYRQWISARLLPTPYREAAQGLVIAMAIGCLFNSFLLDHSEGYFYVVVTGVLFSGLNNSPNKPLRPQTGAKGENDSSAHRPALN
jgi:O-antigen ligase